MYKKDNVLLVEDLMTDGGSKLRFLEAIEKFGAGILGIFVIFNYGVVNEFYTFRNKRIELTFLTNWKYVVDIAINKKILNFKEAKIVENFLFELNIKN